MPAYVVVGKENVRTITRKEHEVFVKLLREVRERRGISQSEVARRINSSQPIIAAIEAGGRRVDVIELIDFANAIGFDPAEFVTDLKARIADMSERKEQYPT